MSRFFFALLIAILPLHLQGNTPVSEAALPEDVVSEDSTVDVEIRRGERTGRDGRSREESTYRNLIEKVEPSGKGTIERLNVYTEFFKREMINDTRLFATDVTAKADADGRVSISGYVMFEENRNALLKLFQYLGFDEVEAEGLEVLPSKSLGEKRFALVKAPSVFSHGAPEDPSERVTQAFLGDPVYLLRDTDGDRILATTAEGYVGFIPKEALHYVSAEEFTAYQSGAHAHLLRDYREGDLFIPAGARLKLQHAAGGADDNLTVGLPDGSELSLPAELFETSKGGTSERTLLAIEVAQSKLGSKYVWGGKTSEGVDCSGLMQSSFKAQGINIPRDAYMQAYMGNLVATRWYRDNLQMGDFVFFLGNTGKISHVGIYIKDGVYLESSGSVKYTSIEEGAENYDARRDRTFCFAKRLLD